MRGLDVLRAYRKEWDEERGIWRDKPRHDWASDGADAFRTMASRYKDIVPAPEKPKPQIEPDMVVRKDGSVKYLKPFNMIEWAESRRRKRLKAR